MERETLGMRRLKDELDEGGNMRSRCWVASAGPAALSPGVGLSCYTSPALHLNLNVM